MLTTTKIAKTIVMVMMMMTKMIMIVVAYIIMILTVIAVMAIFITPNSYISSNLKCICSVGYRSLFLPVRPLSPVLAPDSCFR